VSQIDAHHDDAYRRVIATRLKCRYAIHPTLSSSPDCEVRP